MAPYRGQRCLGLVVDGRRAVRTRTGAIGVTAAAVAVAVAGRVWACAWSHVSSIQGTTTAAPVRHSRSSAAARSGLARASAVVSTSERSTSLAPHCAAAFNDALRSAFIGYGELATLPVGTPTSPCCRARRRQHGMQRGRRRRSKTSDSRAASPAHSPAQCVAGRSGTGVGRAGGAVFAEWHS